ncbi:MAG: hypothetical protein K0R49_60 [Burkholderiales bacterium]|jgi:hypothetical protein|nr:hypothetical protein [Burkholderiales bacterium]
MQEINTPNIQDSSKADSIIKAMKVDCDPRDNEKLPEQKFNELESQYDLLRQMRSGVHAKFIIEHDGKEFPMRLISEEEQQDCFLKALAEFYKLPEYCRIHTHLIDRYNMVFILEKALSSSPLNPNDGAIFMTLKALKSMTSASLSSLFAKYTAMDKQLNPCVDEMSDAEFEFLMEECVKKPELVSSLSVLQLQRITHTYIKHLILLQGK